MVLLGVAGEIDAEQMQAAGQGVGNLQPRLLDALQLMSEAEFVKRVRLYVVQ